METIEINKDAAAMAALGELLGEELARQIAAGDIDPGTVTDQEIINFVFDRLDALQSS